MTNHEAIETIKIAKAEVEWNYPMDYQIAFDMAIETLRAADENDSDTYEQRRQKCIEARQDFYCGTTVTDIITVVKDKFCRDFCKYAEECEAKLEADEDLRPCPLDRL